MIEKCLSTKFHGIEFDVFFEPARRRMLYTKQHERWQSVVLPDLVHVINRFSAGSLHSVFKINKVKKFTPSTSLYFLYHGNAVYFYRRTEGGTVLTTNITCFGNAIHSIQDGRLNPIDAFWQTSFQCVPYLVAQGSLKGFNLSQHARILQENFHVLPHNFFF